MKKEEFPPQGGWLLVMVGEYARHTTINDEGRGEKDYYEDN